MNKAMELRQQRTALLEEADGLVQAAENGSRDLTDTEAARYDEIRTKVSKIDGDIERAEWHQEHMKSIQVPDEARRSGDGSMQVRDRIEDDPNRGFANMGDFAMAVYQASMPGGNTDRRLMFAAVPDDTHRETGSDDGYMVPPAMRTSIWNAVMNSEGLFARMGPEPTNSNTVQYIKDETTPWGSAGIQAAWASELQQIDASKLATKAADLRVNKLVALAAASSEMRADAALLNSRLTIAAPRAINWKLDEAIVDGNGVGKPLGWMQSDALVTVAKENAQTDETIVAENVANMYSRMRPDGYATAFWLTRPECIPQLMFMTIGDRPVWQPPDNFVSAPGGILFGRPVLLSEHAEELGTKGDIQFISPSGYLAVNRSGGVDFASSIHLWFDYDAEAFRWTFRAGGHPLLSAPVSAAKGDFDTSYFVTLAARSS